MKELIGLSAIFLFVTSSVYFFCQCNNKYGPKEIYDSQEISQEKYTEVGEIIKRNPDAVRVYTVDGLQKNEYQLIKDNDQRIEKEKIKGEVIRAIENEDT